MSIVRGSGRRGAEASSLRLAGAALFATLLLAGCARLNERPPQAVDLSGDWQLRKSLSDDPAALLKPRHEDRRQREDRAGDDMATAGPARGSPAGTQGRSPFAGERPDRGEPDFAMLRNLLEQPAELSIRQLSREVRLTADGSPTRYVYGQEAIDSVQGGVAKRTAGWDGSAFVIKYEVRQGPYAARRYEMDATGQWLTVTTKVSGGGGPRLKIHTVYERKPAG